MKIESPSFTETYYDAVVEGYFDRERAALIGRLRRVLDETDAVVPRLAQLGPSESSEDAEWTPLETLAHMSVAAQFFGWLIHAVATKKEIRGDVLELLNLRDPAMIEAMKLPPAELAGQMRTSVERTIAFLEKVEWDDLRNTIAFGNRSLSAEDFARISMTHHLEDHLEQIRSALTTG